MSISVAWANDTGSAKCRLLVLHNPRPTGNNVETEWGCLISRLQGGGQQQGPHTGASCEILSFLCHWDRSTDSRKG